MVGGGVAGVTAAAAAMLHGARVTLLERSEELLHLQRGCHTRHLHPRIYEWPDRAARRGGAGLPVLDWAVGTASEVAERMLADFYNIRLRVAERYHSGRILEAMTSVGDVRLSGNGTSISWTEPRPDGVVKLRQIDGPRAIVLALGSGIERTKNDLPRRSYWRIDSLTQTPLDSEDPNYVVLIAGTGDGGTIDVLRAKLRCSTTVVFWTSARSAWWRLKRKKISSKGCFGSKGMRRAMTAMSRSRNGSTSSTVVSRS